MVRVMTTSGQQTLKTIKRNAAGAVQYKAAATATFSKTGGTAQTLKTTTTIATTGALFMKGKATLKNTATVKNTLKIILSNPNTGTTVLVTKTGTAKTISTTFTKSATLTPSANLKLSGKGAGTKAVQTVKAKTLSVNDVQTVV